MLYDLLLFNEGIEFDDTSFGNKKDVNKNIEFRKVENEYFVSGTNNDDSAMLPYFVDESITEDTIVKFNSTK